VPSEASTGQLLNNWRSNSTKHNLIYLIIFVFNAFFTLAPLVISLNSLVYRDLFQIDFFTYIGLTLAWIGRVISVSSAYILHKSNLKFLVTHSMFKWSRNPISLGLFITFFGFLLVISHFLMIIGYIVFVLNINYKISIEEKSLQEKFGENYHDYIRSTPKYLIK
jgi:protein-S-isoprenylcysteine O-methyltransferase Ste14